VFPEIEAPGAYAAVTFLPEKNLSVKHASETNNSWTLVLGPGLPFPGRRRIA